MLFNSLDFAIFLPIVFCVYWSVNIRDPKVRNIVLLLASYYFYGSWDPRFLGLIILSTICDFMIAQKIAQSSLQVNRKRWVLLSLFINLGILGFFKYCNFFIDNFKAVFQFMGQELSGGSLDIILPVGISFYTFQTLSYTIDVYRKDMKPANDLLAFSTYVAFFPQLVAGPIERATRFLPQFSKPKTFDYSKAADGVRQILWGLFKKVVVADNCAVFVNDIFLNYESYSGATLFLGSILFAFQIYCDFSGYSDIAIGTARLFGYDLMKNFAFPYFSRDIAEFWRRWHISLSTWFRDYLYIPLGGSRGGKWLNIRNVFIIFLVSGFWHGANWTFVAWGFVNAAYFLPLLLLKRNRSNLNTVAENKLLPTPLEFMKMSFTFSIVCLAWVLFRAETIGHAMDYYAMMLNESLFSIPAILSPKIDFVYTMAGILILLLVEWIQRSKEHGLEIGNKSMTIRWGSYGFVVLCIICLGRFGENNFIYFQF